MKWLALCLLTAKAWGLNVPTLPVTTPNPSPAFPAWFDTFNPPTTTAVTDAGASTIACSSQYLEPGRSFAVTGENEPNIYAWMQTSDGNGQWLSCTAVSNSTENWISTLPSGANQNSFALIWSQSATGGALSTPAPAMGAQAWYVNNQGNAGGAVAVGDTINAYGAEFWYGNVTPEVLVTDSGVTSTVCTLTDYDGGRIGFVVPNKTAGYYQVWVHNGHGGQFGWSGPMDLTIGAALDLTVSTITCGACVHDGITDDYTAIQAAVTSADGNSKTAYFPAGNYAVSGAIQMKRRMQFLGDGPSLTNFIWLPSFTGAYAIGDTSGQVDNYVRISGCSFTMNSVSSSSMAGNGNAVIKFTNCSYWDIENVSVTAQMNTYNNTSTTAIAPATGGSANVVRFGTVRNCKFYTYGGYATGQDDTVWKNNTIYGRYDGGGFGEQGKINLDFSNNTAANYDSTSNIGTSSGRLGDLTDSNAGCRNIYWANNTNLGTGAKVGQNSGDGHVIMAEGGSTDSVIVTLTAATSNTVTIPSDPTGRYSNKFHYVDIVKGPGAGQWARVLTDVAGVLTCAEFNGVLASTAWNETPNTSSVVVVSTPHVNFWIGNNNTSGNGVVASNSGIEFYGTVHNATALSNTAKGLATGIYNMALDYGVSGGQGQQGVVSFNYFVANQLRNELTQAVMNGVNYNASITNEAGVYSLDNFYYDSVIVDPGSYAIRTQIVDGAGATGSSNEVGIDGVVVQGTTGSISNGAKSVSDTAGVRLTNMVNLLNFWNAPTARSTNGTNITGTNRIGSNITGSNVN